MAQIQSLAWEIPYDVGVASTKKMQTVSAGLKGSLGFCMSKKMPGNASATGLWTALRVARS